MSNGEETIIILLFWIIRISFFVFIIYLINRFYKKRMNALESNRKLRKTEEKKHKETTMEKHLKEDKILIIDTQNRTKNNTFKNIDRMVQMQMNLASIFMQDEIKEFDNDKAQKLFAFELGIIEYYDRTFLSLDDNYSDNDIFDFLSFYAKNKYKNPELSFEFWKYLLVNMKFLKERELGFNSLNNQINSDGLEKIGHSPTEYLRKALSD